MNDHKNRSAHDRDAEEIRKICTRLSLVDELAHPVLALALDEAQGDKPLVVEAVLQVVNWAHGHHIGFESPGSLVVLPDAFMV